jgi:hypothetical protein
MDCLVCKQPRELSGVACAECLQELKSTLTMTPEQIRRFGTDPTSSVLVDQWGRAHPLEKRTTIGRTLDDSVMTILDATISRRHATLELRGDSWVLLDEGSVNGCYVEEQRVHGEVRLRDGQRVQLGAIRFSFVDDSAAYHLGASATVVLGSHTARGASLPVPEPEPEQAQAQRITLELREPTGGGGGIAIIGGTSVSLTLPQLELLQLLDARAREGGDGFVHPSELIRKLSLDSTDPHEDHIRQLVRRLRRVLYNAGINGLIESGYGVGYRLALLRS